MKKTLTTERADTGVAVFAKETPQKSCTEKSGATNSECGSTRQEPIALTAMNLLEKIFTSVLTAIVSAAHAERTGLPDSRRNALIVKDACFWYK
jgi:hypothetical protein